MVNKKLSKMEKIADLINTLTISEGSHTSRKTGMCVMEAISYIAGEEFSEHPECACPVITAFMISFNDSLPDNASRDRWIKPLIPAIIGSRVFLEAGGIDFDVQHKRGVISGDAVLRRLIPFTLDIMADLCCAGGNAGWAKDGMVSASVSAAALRSLPEQTTFDGLRKTIKAVLVDRSDLDVDHDITHHEHLSVHPGLFNRAHLALVVARGDLVVLNTLAEYADPINMASRAGLASSASRASALGFNTCADKINKTRVDIVLEMLKVKKGSS